MTNSKINYINSFDIDINLATPMIRQFLEIKKNNQDVILLYRMGDFYEAFFEDALILSRDAEITLTGKDAGELGRIPMSGIPAKSIENYIPKLLELNHKIAICEQLEDSTLTKNLVKRGVVKRITAGTLTDLSLLNSTLNNYLAGILYDEKTDLYGFSYTDISTGEFKTTTLNYEQLLAELARINPSEILGSTIVPKVLPFQIVPETKINLPEFIVQNYNCSKINSNKFELEIIKQIFKLQNLDMFDLKENQLGFLVCGAILHYICETQFENLPRFEKIETYSFSEFMSMDVSTRKNLELMETLREKKKFGSLLHVLDKTKTPMGARNLKKWINQPLKNIKQINARHDFVEKLINQRKSLINLTALLEQSFDIERLAMKIANNSANARDFLSLKETLKLIPDYKEILKDFNSEFLLHLFSENSDLVEFCNILEKTVAQNPPITLKEGGLIKEGVSGELDHFKSLLIDGNEWLLKFEEQQRQKTGIKNLKVGFSRTFGYFIEITNSFLNQVPDNYTRRQTLTGAERFITEELKKYENEVLIAQSKSVELEYKIFCDLREYSKEFVEKIKAIANEISIIDTLLSFALCTIENNYVRPFLDESDELIIKEGRHPVVEKILPMGIYVSNDLKLVANSKDKCQFMILTGPNMAGKSTYMRQNAIIVLMAQIGCFVPALEARIGIVDKIFTRVGAVDDLSLGQSTFMVEMSETAYILNSATAKSLILLDEIGRGTSTYDGVAIAWSVSEYIATKIKARTIFATHYHELNVMNSNFSNIRNYRMTITENEGEITFLRKVVEGSTSKSYGIQVAKMAGLPFEVVENAKDLMLKIQKIHQKDLSKKQKSSIDVPQLTLPIS